MQVGVVRRRARLEVVAPAAHKDRRVARLEVVRARLDLERRRVGKDLLDLLRQLAVCDLEVAVNYVLDLADRELENVGRQLAGLERVLVLLIADRRGQKKTRWDDLRQTNRGRRSNACSEVDALLKEIRLCKCGSHPRYPCGPRDTRTDNDTQRNTTFIGTVDAPSRP